MRNSVIPLPFVSHALSLLAVSEFVTDDLLTLNHVAFSKSLMFVDSPPGVRKLVPFGSVLLLVASVVVIGSGLYV